MSIVQSFNRSIARILLQWVNLVSAKWWQNNCQPNSELETLTSSMWLASLCGRVNVVFCMLCFCLIYVDVGIVCECVHVCVCVCHLWELFCWIGEDRAYAVQRQQPLATFLFPYFKPISRCQFDEITIKQVFCIGFIISAFLVQHCDCLLTTCIEEFRIGIYFAFFATVCCSRCETKVFDRSWEHIFAATKFGRIPLFMCKMVVCAFCFCIWMFVYRNAYIRQNY